MRYFKDFPEALNELKRELKEMGLRVHTKSVQNKDISDKPEFETLELQNYTYLVLDANADLIPLINPQWCYAELAERIGGKPLNPGEAWKLREAYWKQFFKLDGTMDYAYPERMFGTLPYVIKALIADPMTRRAYLSVFNPDKDMPESFDTRIPCTLGYWFNYRGDRLNMTYLQRSSDFSEHFNNDVWLARKLQEYVARQAGMDVGTFSHWLGSFHVFAKDVAEVF